MIESSEPALQGDANILENREVRERGGDLEGTDDAAAGDLGRLQPRDILAPVADAPARRRQELGQKIEEGRLAGPVRADHGVDVTSWRVKLTSWTATKPRNDLVSPSVFRTTAELVKSYSGCLGPVPEGPTPGPGRTDLLIGQTHGVAQRLDACDVGRKLRPRARQSRRVRPGWFRPETMASDGRDASGEAQGLWGESSRKPVRRVRPAIRRAAFPRKGRAPGAGPASSRRPRPG